jgi:hypothetical protein
MMYILAMPLKLQSQIFAPLIQKVSFLVWRHILPGHTLPLSIKHDVLPPVKLQHNACYLWVQRKTPARMGSDRG